ncbi:unnamed protein product, partial [Urochloa humidicola]
APRPPLPPLTSPRSRHRPRVHNVAGGRRGRALDGARKRRGGAPHLDFGPLCRWSASAAAWPRLRPGSTGYRRAGPGVGASRDGPSGEWPPSAASGASGGRGYGRRVWSQPPCAGVAARNLSGGWGHSDRGRRRLSGSSSVVLTPASSLTTILPFSSSPFQACWRWRPTGVATAARVRGQRAQAHLTQQKQRRSVVGARQRRSNKRIALAAYSLLPGCNDSGLQLAFLMRGLNLADVYRGHHRTSLPWSFS